MNSETNSLLLSSTHNYNSSVIVPDSGHHHRDGYNDSEDESLSPNINNYKTDEESTTPLMNHENNNNNTINGDEKFISVDEAIEWMGVGKFQIILLFICGIAWMADACEIMLLSFIMPAVSDIWKLGPAQEATIGGIVFAGMLIGSSFWGYICDRFGRKIGIVAVFSICSIFGLASAFCPDFWTLVVVRFFVGFGVGGSHASFSLFTEFLPNKSRGFFLLLIEVFWTVGTVLTSIMALIFLGFPEIFGDYGWRYLVGVSCLPNVLMLMFVPFLPESPRVLVLKGNIEKAERVFKRVAWWNSKPMFEGKLKFDENATKKGGSILLFLTKPLFFSTLLILFLWFAGALAYYGVVVITPGYFGSNGSKLSVYINTIIVSGAELPGLLFAYSVINTFGRKKTISLLFLSTGLFLACLTIPTETWLLTIYAVGARASIMGATCALWVYSPESFPTNVRSLGTGMASASSRVAAIATPYIATMLAKINPIIPVAIYSGSCLIAFIVGHILPYETNGKPLANDISELVNYTTTSNNEREQVQEYPLQIQTTED